MRTDLVEVSSGPTEFSSIISAVAANPDFNTEKMAMLLEMHRKTVEDARRQSFMRDLAEMSRELPVLAKTNINNQTRSKYIRLEQVITGVSPTLAKHGFSFNFLTENDLEKVTVTGCLNHRDGHCEKSSITLPVDNMGLKGEKNKTLVHGIAGSITYAKRYVICALLGIATEDKDGNAQDLEQRLPSVQEKQLEDLLSQSPDATIEEFKKGYPGGVQSVPPEHFQNVCARLRMAIAKAKQADQKTKEPSHAGD